MKKKKGDISELKKLSTDDLYNYLPGLIKKNNITYVLYILKGINGIVTNYKSLDNDYLFRGVGSGGNNLKESILSMFRELIENNYINIKFILRDINLNKIIVNENTDPKYLTSTNLEGLSKMQIVARIRNELGHVSSLIGLTDMYMNGKIDLEKSEYIREKIKENIPKSKESMDYIRNIKTD